jgi:3-oxoacyl-[acyl-carrier protein] reductase
MVPARLEGKTALVIGGSRGIGAAIARRLAAEGADVAVTYRSDADAAEKVTADIEATGQWATAIAADSADPDALRTAIDDAARSTGRLDILVNSAGTLRFKPLEEFTLEDFDDMVHVDLRGAFVAAQRAAEHMTGGRGRIVIIGSNLADYAALPTTSLYSMVKSGLVGLAKGMARDLAPRGITVNVVQPGPIDTDANPQDGPYSDQLKAFIATPTFGTGDDVAGLVAYLASDESQFATGAAFTIDNGYTA